MVRRILFDDGMTECIYSVAQKSLVYVLMILIPMNARGLACSESRKAALRQGGGRAKVNDSGNDLRVIYEPQSSSLTTNRVLPNRESATLRSFDIYEFRLMTLYGHDFIFPSIP